MNPQKPWNSSIAAFLAATFLWFSAGAEWHHLLEHDDHHAHEVESAICDAELHVGCAVCQALPLASSALLPAKQHLRVVVSEQAITVHSTSKPLSQTSSLLRLRGPPVLI